MRIAGAVFGTLVTIGISFLLTFGFVYGWLMSAFSGERSSPAGYLLIVLPVMAIYAA